MSAHEALKGAVVSAQEASQQSDTLSLAMALVQAQALTQPHNSCQCHTAQAPARRSMSPGKVVAVTGAVCAVGTVLTGMFLAIALTAVAVGTSSLVMYGIYRHIMKERK